VSILRSTITACLRWDEPYAGVNQERASYTTPSGVGACQVGWMRALGIRGMLVITRQKKKASVSEIGTSNFPEKIKGKAFPEKRVSVQSGASHQLRNSTLKMSPRKGTVSHWLTIAGSSIIARKYFCDKGGVIWRGSKRES